MKRAPLRLGTWKQGVITLSGVLPVSILLNRVLAPFLGGFLPPIAVISLDATLLVAALNWLLLPALHWVTNGWATRGRHPTGTPSSESTAERETAAEPESTVESETTVESESSTEREHAEAVPRPR